NGDGQEHRRDHIAIGERGHMWVTIRPAGQPGMAGMGGSRIAIAAKPRHRSGLASYRDAGEDDVGLDLLERVIAEADAIHETGTEILHHHIGPDDKLLGDLDAARI